MKKFYAGFIALVFTLLLLAGCAGTEQSTENESQTDQSTQTEESANESAEQGQTSETEQEEAVSITISEDNGAEIIAEEEIPVEEGDILFNVMEENFEVEATEDGFITSIEGVSQDEENGKYWMYEVNGEMAEVGAQEYELSPGDEVTFDLQAME